MQRISLNLKHQLARQWREYPDTHQSRFNIVIHVISVPIFMLASYLVVCSVCQLSLEKLAIGISLIVGVISLQGFGHSLEHHKAKSFRGAGDFFTRILLEQWITFPRFILAKLRRIVRIDG